MRDEVFTYFHHVQSFILNQVADKAAALNVHTTFTLPPKSFAPKLTVSELINVILMIDARVRVSPLPGSGGELRFVVDSNFRLEREWITVP